MCPNLIFGRFCLLVVLLSLEPISLIQSANAFVREKSQGGQDDKFPGVPVYIPSSYPFDPVRNLPKDPLSGRAVKTPEVETEKVDNAGGGAPTINSPVMPVVPTVASDNKVKVGPEPVTTDQTEMAEVIYTEDSKPEQQQPYPSDSDGVSERVRPLVIISRDSDSQFPEIQTKIRYHEDEHQQPLLSSLFPRRGYFSGINVEICRKYPTRLACRYYKRSPWSVSKYAMSSKRFRQPFRSHPGLQYKDASSVPLLPHVPGVRKLNRFSHRQ